MPEASVVVLPSDPTPEVGENKQNSSQSLTALIVFLFIAIIICGGLFTFLLLGSKKYSQTANQSAYAPTVTMQASTSISGTVYFQGYAPANSYIAIAEKSQDEKDFKDIISGLTPDSDGTTEWTWKDAKIGKNYEIKATLKQQGKIIDASPVQKVSAPAQLVQIMLVSQLTPPAPAVATMSGQINLDGYAPAGSTLQVLAKTVSAVSYQTIQSGISAVDNATWNWASAQTGTTYMVKGQLMDANGNVISTGDVQTVTAPSGGELLNVYSTANPPAAVPATSGISGTIIINGSIPSGAYLTLAARPSGTTTFNQVANNISATNSVPFSWNGATSGSAYDVQAYLWVNSNPYSASNIITVTAPSTFDVLTINAQQPTQSPSGGSINVSCGGTQGGLVQATINFNTSANLPNASSYNIVVTSASQNTQVVNTTINPPNPLQSQSITTTYVFQPGATYYGQYAYATSVGGQMSALSPSVQFACQ